MSHRRELTAVNHQFDQPVNLEQGTRGRLYNIAESEGALSDYVAQKWGPSICRVVLICAYGMALFTFITGIVYMTYCPRQYHIAGYLIIGGTSGKCDVRTLRHIIIRAVFNSFHHNKICA
ncbi:hypothetical protein PPYR_09043 [Photinus pyralis]|uniref:Uncharacterized protein n=1 Tax=Photinus pyralis TaxID=7054 RepID=A0A5N4AL33_PHOPY|nr:hypothetical protein PPYR_15595 [Photinus pyralis]KAB0798050.1 hypothetical protein PPYR_09043 [Photinus pyralis]